MHLNNTNYIKNTVNPILIIDNEFDEFGCSHANI
jgi:hypothetical protein